jgi:hypothetical protein
VSEFEELFMTPQEIYRKIKGGPGSPPLDDVQAATRAECELEIDRAHQIEQLSRALEDGWQGEAGGAALSAAVPLREAAFEGSAQLERAQDLLSRQSESFHTAFNEVRPMPDEPPANPMGEAIPFDTDIDKEVRAYQSDAQHNMNIYRGYDNASQYNETHMPDDYTTTNRSVAGASVKPQPDTIEVGAPEPGPGRSDGPGNYSGFTSEPYPGGHGPSGPTPSGSQPGGPVGPGGPGGQTSPNEWRPPVTNSPGQYYNPNYPPVGQSSPVSAAPGGFVPGGGPGGSGAGYGGRGPGTAGGPGPGGGRGYGPGAGVGAGALAAEEAAARRAAQAAGGRAGAGPMGAPAGGGRNKDDDDTEHERKFLIEADAEETFGSDVLTAPQVIGDDEYED